MAALSFLKRSNTNMLQIALQLLYSRVLLMPDGWVVYWCTWSINVMSNTEGSRWESSNIQYHTAQRIVLMRAFRQVCQGSYGKNWIKMENLTPKHKHTPCYSETTTSWAGTQASSRTTHLLNQPPSISCQTTPDGYRFLGGKNLKHTVYNSMLLIKWKKRHHLLFLASTVWKCWHLCFHISISLALFLFLSSGYCCSFLTVTGKLERCWRGHMQSTSHNSSSEIGPAQHARSSTLDISDGRSRKRCSTKPFQRNAGHDRLGRQSRFLTRMIYGPRAGCSACKQIINQEIMYNSKSSSCTQSWIYIERDDKLKGKSWTPTVMISLVLLCCGGIFAGIVWISLSP